MPPARKNAEIDAFPIDWGGLAPLRLRARAVAEGIFSGMHRSLRKGAGVEFGGQRPYVPGDDLRFFDRRALLRHDRLMVREFETETDRALWLVVDATASMSYRGPGAPGAKLAYAALIAAAMARVALASGDPVGLAWIGGAGTHALPAAAGREAFERVVGALEGTRAAQDLSADDEAIERAIAPIARKARRGAVILLISDLLDLPHRALAALTGLGTSGRALLALRVLDPAEARLDFEGNVRLRALEGDAVVEADAGAVRAEYLARLEAIAATWSSELLSRGGRLLRATTADAPTEVVRAVLQAAAEARR
ncbi:MAG: DUF58 domain-containing protein [Polyangiaceae bacterium]|nr:DUF58 domain-containing protein [Polyangiaceae bacterium]